MTRDEVIAAYEATLREFEALTEACSDQGVRFKELNQKRAFEEPPLMAGFLRENKNDFWGETNTRMQIEAFCAGNEIIGANVIASYALAREGHVLANKVEALKARMNFYAAQLH